MEAVSKENVTAVEWTINEDRQMTLCKTVNTMRVDFAMWNKIINELAVYATWFTAGGAIRIAHYDVIDDVITRKL